MTALQAAARPSSIGVGSKYELQNATGAHIRDSRKPSLDASFNRVPSPGIEPGLRPSQSRVRSNTLRGLEKTGVCSMWLSDQRATSSRQVPRRGVEPRPTASKTVMLPSHPRGRTLMIDSQELSVSRASLIAPYAGLTGL